MKIVLFYIKMIQKIKTYTLDEAKHRMESYCAYQERCHKEVVAKLKEMRMIPQAIEVIIQHLLERNYLNESRFAKSFARGKLRVKKWGRNRIEQELKFRGISTYILQEVWQEIEEDYLSVFEEVTLGKFESITEKNPLKARKKFMDYLLYRGWEYELVLEKANEYFKK